MKNKDTELLEEAYDKVQDPVLYYFRQWIKNNPELLSDPKIKEAIDDYDYGTDGPALYLGTILSAGGDYLYDAIENTGLMDELKTFITSQGVKNFDVIPYSEYQWNEDNWGENL